MMVMKAKDELREKHRQMQLSQQQLQVTQQVNTTDEMFCCHLFTNIVVDVVTRAAD